MLEEPFISYPVLIKDLLKTLDKIVKLLRK